MPSPGKALTGDGDACSVLHEGINPPGLLMLAGTACNRLFGLSLSWKDTDREGHYNGFKQQPLSFCSSGSRGLKCYSILFF